MYRQKKEKLINNIFKSEDICSKSKTEIENRARGEFVVLYKLI